MVAEMGSEKAIGCHTRVGRRGFRGLEAIRGSFGKRSGDVKVRGTRAGATRKKMAVRGRGVRGGGTEPRNGKGGRRRAEGGRIDDRGWSGQGGTRGLSTRTAKGSGNNATTHCTVGEGTVRSIMHCTEFGGWERRGERGKQAQQGRRETSVTHSMEGRGGCGSKPLCGSTEWERRSWGPGEGVG